MVKVAVILSSYNGEKYIQEQILSIINQKQVDVRLFIRDDGSSDSTVEIVKELCQTYSNIIFTNKGKIENIGVRNSFLTLLDYAVKYDPDTEYYCFADQDDVWLENKIIEAVRCFLSTDRNILYFSNKTIVDSNLKIIYNENIEYYNDILEICWGAQASGCTMLFDTTLARIVLSNYKNINLLHDSLFYRVAHIVGTKIVFDRRSFILYRQHQANVIGISGSTKTNYNWKGLFSKSECFISNLTYQLLTSYSDYITPSSRQYLEMIINYKHSIKSCIRLIFNNFAWKRPLKLYAIWVGKIILHRL